MPTVKHSKQTPVYVLELMIAVLVLVSVGVLTAVTLAHANVDCQKLTDETQVLIVKEKYQQAYDKLKPYRSICGEPNAKINPKHESAKDKIRRFEFHHHLAVAAYIAKDKATAESEADKALLIIQKLSVKDRENVATSFVFDMGDVKSGRY